MKPAFFLVIAATLVSIPLFAQRERAAKGSYIYYLPDNQTLEQARLVAVDRVMAQLLSEEYGTDIQSTTATMINNSANGSSVRTATFAESTIKGEWIRTTSGPDFEYLISQDGMIGIKVTLAGRIREIPVARSNVEAHVLVNGTEGRFENNSCKSGDDLYISFRSPEDGFLTIFLFDGDNDVHCLLPYSSQPILPVFVQGGQDYIFFSPKGNTLPIKPEYVDELTMTCSEPMEINRIYLLFSPDKYSCANISQQTSSRPRALPLKDFQAWMADLRRTDNGMVVKTSDITIKQ